MTSMQTKNMGISEPNHVLRYTGLIECHLWKGMPYLESLNEVPSSRSQLIFWSILSNQFIFNRFSVIS